MRNYRANVLLHLDRRANRDRPRDVEATLRDQKGVFNAQPSAKLPNFLFVHYDPTTISSEAILARVRGCGIDAQLIGL